MLSPVRNRADGLAILLLGITAFVFAAVLALFGGHYLVPLLGRTVGEWLVVVVTITAIVLIGYGAFRALVPTRSRSDRTN